MSDKLKILVVDDNEEFCRNITDILELKGYEGVSAYDGFALYRILRSVEPKTLKMTLRRKGKTIQINLRLKRHVVPPKYSIPA